MYPKNLSRFHKCQGIFGADLPRPFKPAYHAIEREGPPSPAELHTDKIGSVLGGSQDVKA